MKLRHASTLASSLSKYFQPTRNTHKIKNPMLYFRSLQTLFRHASSLAFSLCKYLALQILLLSLSRLLVLLDAMLVRPFPTLKLLVSQ